MLQPGKKDILPETNIPKKKWMVGILVSFWNGLVSGAMLVSGRVPALYFLCKRKFAMNYSLRFGGWWTGNKGIIISFVISIWFDFCTCVFFSQSNIYIELTRWPQNSFILSYTLGIQSYSQMMIGVSNHLLSIVLRFHYHSQKMIGSLGTCKKSPSWMDFCQLHRQPGSCFQAGDDDEEATW